MEVFRIGIFMILFVPVTAFSVQTIQMTIGEQKTLDLVDQGKIHVSRRGVIHIQQEENHEWSITALRKGMVAIQTESKQGEKVQAFIVKVDTQQEVTEERQSEAVTWCARLKQQCNVHGKTLEGYLNDAKTFYELRNLCLQDTDCIFHLTLTKEAVDATKSKLLEHFTRQNFYWSVHQNGSLQVTATCGNKKKDDLLQFIQLKLAGLDFATKPNLFCRDQLESSQYEIKGKIILARQSESKMRGQPPNGSLTYDFTRNALDTALVASLKALDQFQEINVVGEPSGLVESGTPLIFKSGGEALFVSENDDSEKGRRLRSVWKEYGVFLQVAVTPSTDANQNATARLELDFSLRHPSQAGPGSDLSLNQIKTNLNIPLGKDILVGQADVHHDTRSRENIPVLSDFPIVGPLFSKKFNDEQKSKILIFINVRELEPN